MHTGRIQLFAGAVAGLLLVCSTPALAQSSDRERAQMLQMQQQLQRLQSDNASLQRERTQLETQAKDADRLKKESAQTSKELSKSRAEATAVTREAAALRAEVESLHTQLDQWKKAVEERDAALQAAAAEKRRTDAEVTLLSGRLKVQTGRADLCEVKDAQALTFGTEVVDRYEKVRLRMCEPVTGIWAVRNEQEIQQMRDRLYELRLDVPPASASK